MLRRTIALVVALGTVTAACSVHRIEDRNVSAAGPGGSPTSAAPGSAAGLPTDAGATPSGADATPAGGTPPAAGTATAGGQAPGQGAVPTTEAPPSAPVGNIDPPPGEARTASDRGVSADEIVLGILHTADSFFAAAGAETKDVEAVIAPFIAEINDAGGINGRRVVTRISRYDPLSPDSMNAACVEQAEDHKVFASIAQIGFWGDSEICMANKETPLLTGNNSSAKTNVERERGWVRQTHQNKDRNIKNWIDWMIDSGLLDATTRTGLIYVDVPEDRDLVNEVVLPYMDSRGLPRPEVTTLSASIAQTPSESQAAVLRYKTNGVQLVLPLVSFLRILIFAEQAEAAQYRPAYSVSDFGLLATDAMAGMPPSQWEGVRGITVLRTGIDPPGALPSGAGFADCHDTYRRYGEDFAPHPDDPSRPEPIEVANMMHYCQHIALFAEAARRAGLNPTRRGYLAQFDTLGTWAHRVVLSERLTFGPGKYDGADLYAVVEWRSGCTSDGGCYRQVEGFRAGRW